MASKTRILASLAVFFLATLFLPQNAFSQRTFFQKNGPGWYTLGIDGGLAWQTSDVQTAWNGGGGGLTLAKNLAYRPGGWLSFDLRGRLLYTRSFGADHRRSLLGENAALNGSDPNRLDYFIDLNEPIDSSFVFANHRTSMFEGGLEGVLTFNRLRERTGLVISLFGGVGLDWYRTKIDQADASGIYAVNYLKINQLASRRDIIGSLDGIRDRRFETLADGFENESGKVGFMPGAGVEIGFQVTPRFVIGVGHKLTFSRTDYLDGHAPTTKFEGLKDIAHYTNLHLRWDLEPATRRPKAPEIVIVDPKNNPHQADSPNYFVRATIKNVQSAVDVEARLNGNDAPFRFSNENFGASIRLKNGRNELKIRASNPVGSDEKTVVFFFKDESMPLPPPPPPPSEPRPEVRFTNPDRSPMTVEQADFQVRADVRNVRSSRDLRFFVNGEEETRFSFNNNFEASIRLREGRNTVRLEVRNGAGQASDEAEIRLETRPADEKPRVSITRLADPTGKNRGCQTSIEARIEHVERREDIQVLLNRREISDWNWTRGGLLTADFDLIPGENRIVVKASNRAGSDQDERTVNCREAAEPTGKRPIVNFTEPGQKSSVSEKATTTVRASVLNIGNRNDLTFKVNGATSTSFDFDSRTQILIANLTLKSGENTVSIKAQNPFGVDEQSVKIIWNSTISLPKKPKVTISEPTDGQKFVQKTCVLAAKIEHVNDKNQVRVTRNGSPVSGVDFDPKRGVLKVTIELLEGENRFVVSATNADGSAEDAATVYFSKAKKPPVVSISSPKNGSVTDKKETQIEATISEMTSALGVSFTVNGLAVTRFSFAEGKFSGTATLKEGENTAIIKATNADGSDEKTVKITLKSVKADPPMPVQPKPTVAFTEPKRAGGKTATVAATLKFTAQNVAAASELKLTQNGQPVEISSFNSRSGEGSAAVKLVAGENKFKLEAATKSGSASAETSLVLELKSVPAEQKPAISIESASQPVGTPTAPNVGKSTVIAKIQHIRTAGQITVLLNGKPVEGFSFNSKTGVFQHTFTLERGNNTVVIKAKNTAGEVEASRVITF